MIYRYQSWGCLDSSGYLVLKIGDCFFYNINSSVVLHEMTDDGVYIPLDASESLTEYHKNDYNILLNHLKSKMYNDILTTKGR